MKIRNSILFTAISAALAGTPVMAATSISSGFAGPGLDAGLATTYSGSGSLAVGGTAVFTGNYWAGTTATDYATSTNNWTATIEVSGSADWSRYFGLGTGTTAGTGDPYYETPQGVTGQPATYMMAFSQANGAGRSLQTQRTLSPATYWGSEVNKTDAEFDTIVGTTGGIINNAFYRYSMAYDYAAQTLTFDVDQISAFGGTVTNTTANNVRVVSLTGMGYDGTNGKIFFGGSGTFDNLNVTVIPEPSAALIGGLGMLCLLRRRRA